MTTTISRHASVACALTLMLAACNGPSGQVAMPETFGGRSPAGQDALVNAPLAGPAAHVRPARRRNAHDLYVTDQTSNAVDIIDDRNYRDVGSITTGISTPGGVFLDKRGNVYVANSGGGTVTEYPPGQTSPSVTYSAGMVYPAKVTVDSHGDVFETDVDGNVREYFQGINTVIAQCQPFPNQLDGVAVDSSGDVFVAYYTGSVGNIVEYAGGLHGCNATTLGISLSYPAGIALDNNRNLIACDPFNHEVDVIAPPYTSVTRTIGGWAFPWGVTLNKSNTRLFVTDIVAATVTIVDYATGANLRVLGSANGIGQPEDAVEEPNAVY
jgi:hypothetical protein